MVATRYPAEIGVNAREQQVRAEWRRLCFVLEGIQATHIIEQASDKFAFARAYVAYRDEELRAFAVLARRIAEGDYRFFVDRGVPPSILADAFARQLLRDWKGAIASKQARLAEAFEGRYGEDIDVFSATPRNGVTTSEPNSSDSCNALSLLDRWAASRAPAA